MADFIYTTVPGKVPALMQKIREVGRPPKATAAWLKSIGFTSSNDPSLLPILEFIDFVDAQRVPTQRWKDYRGADYKKVLGDAIVAGYASLYATYPDAHNRGNSDLEAFFASQTSAGKQAISKMVSTFKNLSQNAEFGAAEVGVVSQPDVPPAGAGSSPAVVKQGVAHQLGQGVIVNINIELTLPETEDAEMYDKFFKAMRKHLLSAENE